MLTCESGRADRCLISGGRPHTPNFAASDGCVMKMVAEYLEKALHFEQMAAQEKNPSLKADLEAQASAYRALAKERARREGLPNRRN